MKAQKMGVSSRSPQKVINNMQKIVGKVEGKWIIFAFFSVFIERIGIWPLLL
jgi:hypothetical protein